MDAFNDSGIKFPSPLGAAEELFLRDAWISHRYDNVAEQQTSGAHVRDGSKADIGNGGTNVRFTPVQPDR